MFDLENILTSDLLLTCGKYLQDHFNALGGGGGGEGENNKPRHALLKCLYQPREVSDHVFMCKIFASFYDFSIGF